MTTLFVEIYDFEKWYFVWGNTCV